MSRMGQDVIDIGLTRVGQQYVFGAVVPLDNPGWKGPWDCAEFASWCAYQAYGLIFGAGGATRPAKAEPYSGYWHAEAKKSGHVVSWQEALHIPGAALIRAPATGRPGHVAFAVGDGERTLEARGAAFGINIFTGAASRPWTIGCLLPGVDYGTERLAGLTSGSRPRATSLPDIFLWFKTSPIKGAAVVALQKALLGQGLDPGPIDGAFGPMTHAAVLSFQLMRGIEVDGVVGPATARALGLPFPLAEGVEDVRLFNEVVKPKGPCPLTFPPSPDGFDAIAGITQSGKTFSATTASGEKFIIGSITTYTDDMHRTGLFQGNAAIKDSLRFGVYRGRDFVSDFGPWAHFIEPTLLAEGEARFATLNTYDRAAFTFGAPQLAAHTPGRNFVAYFRQLLALPLADRHFPELALRPNSDGKITIHLQSDTGPVDLEEVVMVTRPNGVKEPQLAKLMAYCNTSPTAVDEVELLVAARLMNWLRLDPRAKQLQIAVFLAQAKENLEQAKTKVPGLVGSDWETALWIMDILHQGRGTYAEMRAALASANPKEALRRIGLSRYRTRIVTIAKAVAGLKASGLLDGFTV
ncbi:Peptidoglycan-binding domain 1 protein [Solidesulfovibrio fructosivorans JJ]]|uniref:Peptidoglycan-binding domain 1 protein n=1 Tax=Solidesulfovibrio fructosivorans JJ] TaxID=596151 RepID=E1JTE6_SOLFR|nr:peptidoglycan-binding protein [Solidesulfovibrio fructosivorans]EFL52406.1 Peptidoglycan-binding domain 1 protein [Solidesulfovibrio fructosivorans JJ]]